MRVVAASSLRHALVLIEAIDVLPASYQRVVVLPLVMVELSHPPMPHTVRTWTAQLPVRLTIQQPVRASETTVLTRDAGERQAMLLAQELRADLLVIGEKDGRRVARQRSVTVLDILGVLARAAAQGLPDVPGLLTRLRATHLCVTEAMVSGFSQRYGPHKTNLTTTVRLVSGKEPGCHKRGGQLLYDA